MKIHLSLVLYQHSIQDISPLLSSVKDLAENCVFHKFYFSVFVNKHQSQPLSKLDFSQYLACENLSLSVVYSSKNIGFGPAHNRNLLPSIALFDYVFIINPDVSFSTDSFLKIIKQLDNDTSASCIAPLIVNSCGSIQYSAKNNPTFFSLLIGFLSQYVKTPLVKSLLRGNQNRSFDYSSDIIECTYLSGCFLAVRSHAYYVIGGFDENFFLHLEDADLSRRLSHIGKVYHFPSASICHGWARGSHKSWFQIQYLLRSYVYYVQKWGFTLF